MPAQPARLSIRHVRAADAYGLQTDLQDRAAVPRPGTVFSEKL